MFRNFLLVVIAWALATILAVPTFVAMLAWLSTQGKEVIEKYLLRVAVGIDQMGAALLNWNPDSTISGNIGYRIRKGKATLPERVLCAVLRRLDVNHCLKSIEPDEVYE